MAQQFKAYFIQCLTNMHVGSGDASYGVVDKLVQRDPVTGHPTIHSSSLKGALREHFEEHDWGKNSKKVNDIFGTEAEGNQESETGNYRFLGADLVSLPVRCNFQQFVMGVNQTQLQALNKKAKMLSGGEVFNAVDASDKLYYKANLPTYEVFAEDISIGQKAAYEAVLKATAATLETFSSKFASFSDDHFKSISKDLPVIARNKLENGASANLWYEEVVPHQSVFLTFFTAEKEEPDFETKLKGDVIQIGGNASIGYGLCKFHEITFPKNEKA